MRTIEHAFMQRSTNNSLAILLATYNGSAHIQEQIESIAMQQDVEISLFVSDDGSTDDTRKIVENFGHDHRFKRVEISEGPQTGFANNFKKLILGVDEKFDYYAFSDQDDIWLPNRLTGAFETLARLRPEIAGVSCGRTEIISENGSTMGYSPLFAHPPGFRNAIVQSIAGGNTMILNNAAMRLLKFGCARTDFLVHDWFCYLVVTGSGGVVVYDPSPTVRYRQHDHNLIGSNSSFKAKLKRIVMLFSGRFAGWNSQNIAALEKLNELLTPDARQVLAEFKEARSAPLPRRLVLLRKSGVFRQSKPGTISLFVACLFKRL